MDTLETRSRQANELRKNGRYEDALKIYRELWDGQHHDGFTAAGLLHCLRKLHRLDEAMTVADDIAARYPDHNWVNLEVAWAYADYVKGMAENGASVPVLHACGEKALSRNPPPQAVNHIAFAIMGPAKKAKDWNMLTAWMSRVDPSLLSPAGMKLPDGKEGWSYLARWYHYRNLGLISTGRAHEALPLCREAVEKFPNQYKFFAYDLAKAYAGIGEYEKAAETFDELCRNVRPDSYHLFEYGKVVHQLGRPEEALALMARAVKAGQRPEFMVGYFMEMGDIFKQVGRLDAARDHYTLATAIRMRNSWSVPPELQQRLDENAISSIEDSVEELTYRCSRHWSNCEAEQSPLTAQHEREKPLAEGVVGRIFLGHPDREYFFINPPDADGYIGFKNELTWAPEDRSLVVFDIVPSFNRKKNEWAAKAANVRPKDDTAAR